MQTLLKQLIIPTVEYCCPVWSPGDANNINKLEKIQRSFTKRIHGFNKTHYWDRLAQLHLFSLQRRRERYLIIYIWKIIHGLVPDVGVNYAPTNSNDAIKLRLPTLEGPAHAKKLMENGLLYHGVKLFNMIPEKLRRTTAGTEPILIDTFKNQLDAWLWRIPDEPGPAKGDRIRAAATNSITDQINYLKPPTDTQAAPRNRRNTAGKKRQHASEFNPETFRPAPSRWDKEP